jgi:hypothetical protein
MPRTDTRLRSRDDHVTEPQKRTTRSQSSKTVLVSQLKPHFLSTTGKGRMMDLSESSSNVIPNTSHIKEMREETKC